jgi:hypothetical protein
MSVESKKTFVPRSFPMMGETIHLNGVTYLDRNH